MQTQLFDVTQNEERIFDLAVLHNLLQVLVLDQVLVDELLSGSQRKPNDEVRLQGQLIEPERSAHRLSADNFEYHVFRAPQKVTLVHRSQLLAQGLRLRFLLL